MKWSGCVNDSLVIRPENMQIKCVPETELFETPNHLNHCREMIHCFRLRLQSAYHESFDLDQNFREGL